MSNRLTPARDTVFLVDIDGINEKNSSIVARSTRDSIERKIEMIARTPLQRLGKEKEKAGLQQSARDLIQKLEQGLDLNELKRKVAEAKYLCSQIDKFLQEV